MKYDLYDGETLVNSVNASKETVESGFFDPLTAMPAAIYHEAPSDVPVMPMVDVVVTSGGDQIQPSGSKYYLPPGVECSFTARIDGGDEISIDIVKLVAQECADDMPNGSEFYVTSSISNGVVSGVFKFPVSTNYKISSERNNRALDRMFGASPLHLSFETLDFLS